MSNEQIEFQKELERLHYTKEYMDKVLQRSKGEIEAADDKIREAMANIDYLDSSDSFMNILTNSRFYELARTQKEGLEAIKQKPYFARIHFQRTGEEEELLYIGKTSLFESETNEPIIIDWRSPVANVYYDGRLGDLTYYVRDEEHHGHLYTKRQYKIEKGELIHYRDIDLTTNDEILQDALEGKADVRLTEIVSTIQKEQNEVIRAHLKQPIVVQGAAGSGKTTIALHRISYFLYTMGNHFKPEKLMILAPNNLFIEYISDVLPELGVNKICQTTYATYVQNATKLKLKIDTSIDMLERKIEQSENWVENSFDISRIKGTLFYKEVMDRILRRIEETTAATFNDVYIEKYRILPGSHLKKLFLIDFAYMPIEKRLERIKMVLQTEVKRKGKAIINKLKLQYEEAIERSLNGIRDPIKRKRVVTKFLDEREERLPKIEVEIKSATKNYMQPFKKIKVKELYRTFVTTKEKIETFIPEWNSDEVEIFLQTHKKERWTNEDLAAIYYLFAKIKGISDEWKMQVVFIDEVQDYSLFQLAALKEGLETDMFTMVGDLAQGIHSYRSLTSWEPVLELFPRANFTTLQKSYRTTIEIMDVANELLQQLEEDLPLVEPVVRHGPKPKFILSKFQPATIVHEAQRLREKFNSVAFICKTKKEAKRVFEELESFLRVQLLEPNSTINSDAELLIVPSYLAKGLEFDAVIVGVVEEAYAPNSFERKLLYVALTRAMHELVLIGPSKQSFLLKSI